MSINVNGRAEIEDPFRSSFHGQEISAIFLVFILVNGHFLFVTRLERNFADFRVT